MAASRLGHLALASCLLLAAPDGRVRGDLVARFRSEYPPAAAAMQEALSRVGGRGTWSREAPDGRRRHAKLEFAVAGDSKKVEIGRIADPARPRILTETVVCVSPLRTFRLVRAEGAARYQVQNVGPDSQDAMSYMFNLGRFLEAPYALNNTPLRELMALPTFEILDARPERFGGSECIRLECRVGEEGAVDGMTFVLDPANGWAIRHGELRPHGLPGAQLAYDVDYRPGTAGLPVPRKVTVRDVDLSVTTCEFHGIEPRSFPPDEFTMARYGLEEVARRPPEGSGLQTPLLLGCMGVAGLAIAFALRRLSVRGS